MVRKKEKNKLSLVIFILILSLVLFLVALFYGDNVLEEKKIYSTLLVGSPLGFDLNNTTLTFGRIPQGSSVKRDIFISNNYEFPIVARLSSLGNISEFLIFDSEFFLDIGEQENVTINTISIPYEIPDGDYSGNIVIKFTKA